MREDESLLQTVIEHPDDDYPRLCYADWLEEHGQQERAEFIRVQCELESIDKRHHDWPRLKAREVRLLESHQEAWLEPFRPFDVGKESLSDDHVHFSRGFVEEVPLTCKTFLARGEELLRLSPIRSLTLTEMMGRGQELAQCPTLDRFQSLRFYFSDLSSKGLSHVLASPYLTALRSFGLVELGLGADWLELLVSSPVLAQLNQLELSANHVKPPAMACLAGSPSCRALHSLDVGNSGLRIEGFRALASSPNLAGLRALHSGFT